MKKVSENILIIDDDEDIRESLQELLVLSGYNVSIAENGKVGFEAILNEQPDLVLCDIHMPEMNGLELLKMINLRMEARTSPSFIFLTALIEKEDIRNGMNLGADDYILKPFKSIDVINAIQLRLKKRGLLLRNNGSVSNNPKKSKELNKLALPSSGGIELVPFKNIIRCEADRSYCTFYLVNNKKNLISKSMKEYEEILLKHNFFKVHKSHIVNLSYVEKYIRGKGGYLILSDKSQVAVSLKRKEELLNVIAAKV